MSCCCQTLRVDFFDLVDFKHVTIVNLYISKKMAEICEKIRRSQQWLQFLKILFEKLCWRFLEGFASTIKLNWRTCSILGEGPDKIQSVIYPTRGHNTKTNITIPIVGDITWVFFSKMACWCRYLKLLSELKIFLFWWFRYSRCLFSQDGTRLDNFGVKFCVTSGYYHSSIFTPSPSLTREKLFWMPDDPTLQGTNISSYHYQL